MTLLLALSGLAHASIVNVLTPQVGEPEEGFTGQIRGAVSLKQGNEEATSIAGEVLLQEIDGDHTLLFIANQSRSTAFGELTGESAFAHLRYIQDLNDRWSAFGFVQGYQNPFRDLQVRSLGGAGIDVQLARTEIVEIHMATSMMAEYELLSEGVEDDDGLVGRSSSYLLIAVDLDEDLTLSSSTYFQPLITDPMDFRFLEEATLTAALGEHFSWYGTAKLEYDARPASGVGEMDLRAGSGLAFSW